MRNLKTHKTEILIKIKSLTKHLNSVETFSGAVQLKGSIQQILEELTILEYLENTDLTVETKVVLEDIAPKEEKIEISPIKEVEVKLEEPKLEKLPEIKEKQTFTTELEEEQVVKKLEEEGVLSDDNLVEKNIEIPSTKIYTGDLPNIKLDLNSLYGFKFKLFGGSELDLKKSLDELNNTLTIIEAGVIFHAFSEKYKWDEKVETYKERFWNLIENRFED